MRYIKLSLEYMMKNFWYILPLSIIPALIIGIGTEPCSMLQYFVNFLHGKYASFGDVFLAQSELTWISLLAGILLFPIIVVCISGMSGMISRHMRYGIINFENLNRRINNNFVSVCLLALLFLLVTQIYALICTSLSFVYLNLLGTSEVALALTIITNIIFMVICLFVFAFCSVALPIMSINGLRLRKALAESIRLVKPKIFSVFLAIVLPLILPFTIMGVLSAFDFWWRKIINPFIFVFIFCYYITFMYVTYCELADFDREDIKDKYIVE